MAVLLQFNMAKQHAVEYLQEATQLQADVLRQVLQILIRIKLLVSLGSKVRGQRSEGCAAICAPPIQCVLLCVLSHQICEDDTLQPSAIVRLYEGYKKWVWVVLTFDPACASRACAICLGSKKLRVNINVPLKSETKREQEETHKHIEEDRKLVIQVSDTSYVCMSCHVQSCVLQISCHVIVVQLSCIRQHVSKLS